MLMRALVASLLKIEYSLVRFRRLMLKLRLHNESQIKYLSQNATEH